MDINTTIKQAEFEYKLRNHAKFINLSKYFFPFIHKLKEEFADDDIVNLNILNNITNSEHVWNKLYSLPEGFHSKHVFQTINEKIDQVIVDMQIDNMTDTILDKIFALFSFIPDENSL